jgi:hypothetical protein
VLRIGYTASGTVSERKPAQGDQKKKDSVCAEGRLKMEYRRQSVLKAQRPLHAPMSFIVPGGVGFRRRSAVSGNAPHCPSRGIVLRRTIVRRSQRS